MTAEKKPLIEKHYAIPSCESIKIMADSCGHEINDEVAALLAEDVSYRLRQIAQSSCMFMRHAKRRKLTVVDFNRALKHSDVAPIHGHDVPDATLFRPIKDADVFAADDPEVSLIDVALNDEPVCPPGETSVKAHWLAIEGIQKTNAQKVNGGKISDDLLLYYDQIAKAVLSSDRQIVTAALIDLRSNPNILPIFSYFVNFVSTGVTKVSHDITQIMKLLQTIQALINNETIFMEPWPYLSMLVQAVMYCVVEPLAASINPLNDHWRLRDYAARLLAQITHKWNNVVNQLLFKNTQSLKDVLYGPDRAACSRYGAVVGLSCLGVSALDKVVIPYLPSYFARRQEQLDSTSGNLRSDAFRVDGAILRAVEIMLKHEPENVDTAYNAKMAKLYNDAYEQYGDKLSCLAPSHTSMFICPRKQNEAVQLHAPLRSGEEMLSEFMDMVKRELPDEAKSDQSYRSQDENDLDSPSYRSDRSDRSEEIFDDSVHLTVKSTVNDPALGIKLTITKRPLRDDKKRVKKRKIKYRLQDVFDKVSYRYYQPFVFNVPRLVKWTSRPPRREFSIDFSPTRETVEFRRLCLAHSISAKAKKRIRKRPFIHVTSGSIFSSL